MNNLWLSGWDKFLLNRKKLLVFTDEGLSLFPLLTLFPLFHALVSSFELCAKALLPAITGFSAFASCFGAVPRRCSG